MRVYFDMFDKLHVLHNAQYLLLFERARWDFWDHIESGPEAADAEWPYFVVRNAVDYRKAIREPQEVLVEIQIAAIGNSSLTFRHRLYDQHGELCTCAETVLVRVDAETQRPMPWSARLRTLIAPYLISQD
jgi:acyl-CoA thioester hydrolase